MRAYRIRVPLVVLGLVGSVGLLGACAPQIPESPPAPAATQAPPIFDSDEEALAAAIESYEAYLAVMNEISANGGRSTGSLDAVAVAQAFDFGVDSAHQYADAGYRSVGRTDFAVRKLQAVEHMGNGKAVVTFYVCDDLHALDVVNSSGSSVVQEGRRRLIPFVVSMEARAESRYISSKVLWTGADFCLD